MKKRILIVSYDQAILHEVESIVRFLEYELTALESLDELLNIDSLDSPLMVLLHLPSDQELQQAVSHLLGHFQFTELYTLQESSSGSIEFVLPGVKAAIEYPIKYRQLLGTIREVERRKNSYGQSSAEGPQVLTGSSEPVQRLQQLAQQVANTDATVLLQGESGTGKEVVAKAIHEMSDRRDKPFVAVNCGAIPDDLIESELFGHEKGAFTGAVGTRRGRFELAENGTLFLDEIGDMPMLMQVKLLRVLQEKSFQRVGGGREIACGARIITATHQDLEQKVRDREFRLDLFYRLNIFPIELPSLRERREDIPALIENFSEALEKRNMRPARLAEDALEAIQAASMPGNVRELENLIERLAIQFPDKTVCAQDLPPRFLKAQSPGQVLTGPRPLRSIDAQEDIELHTPERSPYPLDDLHLPQDVSLKEYMNGIERSLLLDALVRSDWVVSQAAKVLGLQRTTLVEKMRKFSISRSA